MSDELIERFSRLAFHFGVAIAILFLVWIQLSQLDADPEWWDPGMVRAFMIGMIALIISVALPSLKLFYDGIVAVWHGGDG